MKKSTPVSRSGRFADGPAADVARFTESISFDWRLWRQDIAGSKAHAAMLQSIGLLTAAELREIRGGLDQIAAEIEAGAFSWKAELEDVHMNIEAELTRRVPAGAKLHTARSRNDQVALDMRLWLRDEIAALRGEIGGLQSALVDLGEREIDVVIPGYTHLQRAQPVYLATRSGWPNARSAPMCVPSAMAPSPDRPCRLTGRSWPARWGLSMPKAARN